MQTVIDVNERTWATEVVERSAQVPVVVDFWAPWCGPCRTLGPTLERLAREADGAWALAKLNVDDNQRIARQWGVQGIPDVKGFRDGKVVAQFTGALPESQVRTWLKQLVPSRVDQIAEQAMLLEATQPDQAAERYREALQIDPQHARSLLGLGRILVLESDPEATAVLDQIKPGSPEYAQAQALHDLHTLLTTQADEGTPAASAWQAAAKAARQQDWQGALDHLLTIVLRDRAFKQDAARRAMLAIFALLGAQHPLTIQYRQRLASALF